MAEIIENLEFQEIKDIPVTEDKGGFYAIGHDAQDDAKKYPLNNFKTADEVDGELIYINKKVDDGLTNVNNKVGNIQSSMDAVEKRMDSVEQGRDKDKGYFSSESALKTAHPNPTAGEWANVAGIIYECQTDGTWTNTGKQAPTPDLDLSEYAKKEIAFTDTFVSTTELDNIKDTGIYKRVEGVMPMIVWVHKQSDGVTVTQLRIHIGNDSSIIETRKFSSGVWSSWKNDAEKWFSGSWGASGEMDNLKTSGYYIRKVAGTNNAPVFLTARALSEGRVVQYAQTLEANGTVNYQTRIFDGSTWGDWTIKTIDQIYTLAEKEKLAALQPIDIDILFTNIATNSIDNYTVSNCEKSLNEDGSVRIYTERPTGSSAVWVTMNNILTESYKKNHDYYVAFDLKVDNVKDTTTRLTIRPKYTDHISVGTGAANNQISKGERGILKGTLNVDDTPDTYPTAKNLFMQFNPQYQAGDILDISIYNVFVADMGERDTEDYTDWSTMDSYFEQYGFIQTKSVVEEAKTALIAQTAISAKTSETANTANIANIAKLLQLDTEIECWGDSLTAQNFGQFIEQITGRKVYINGFGGQTSRYIRDKFIAGANINRTQVLWIGRNNFGDVAEIIDDYRAMIDHLGHNRFILMNAPNGGNPIEIKGGGAYYRFTDMIERFTLEYPDNFLNIRQAVINGYNMGGIRLLSSFTQPALNDTVQINVSDANFLTNLNSSDVDLIGSDIMNSIRIGFNGMDRYEIVSKDSDNMMTVKFVEQGYKASGETVGNLTDQNDSSVIRYIRVWQNGDWWCFNNDTWPSTFRKDSIHIDDLNGRTDCLMLIARIITRKLEAMKI